MRFFSSLWPHAKKNQRISIVLLTQKQRDRRQNKKIKTRVFIPNFFVTDTSGEHVLFDFFVRPPSWETIHKRGQTANPCQILSFVTIVPIIIGTNKINLTRIDNKPNTKHLFHCIPFADSTHFYSTKPKNPIVFYWSTHSILFDWAVYITSFIPPLKCDFHCMPCHFCRGFDRSRPLGRDYYVAIC